MILYDTILWYYINRKTKEAERSREEKGEEGRREQTGEGRGMERREQRRYEQREERKGERSIGLDRPFPQVGPRVTILRELLQCLF